MDEIDTMVRAAKARFDKAAESLASKYPEDTVIGREVREFVKGCQYNMTGNHYWRYGAPFLAFPSCSLTTFVCISLVSTRYGLANTRKGQSLIFTF